MNIRKLLDALRDERERLNIAIMAMERLAQASGSSIKRRGRPPGSKNVPRPTNSSPEAGSDRARST
jgi:hypothetical protein